MKIFMNRPKYHWLSPYKIIETVIFWKDVKYQDYEKASNFLTPFCEGLKKFLDFIHPEINYIKIDRWDCWSMDQTLSQIIHPMLVQLKKDKQGYGYIEHHHAPEHLRFVGPLAQHDWFDPFAGARYEWLLDELIWTFEQLKPDSDWDAPYYEGVFDKEGYMKHSERIKNGLVLFGTYFQTLWD